MEPPSSSPTASQDPKGRISVSFDKNPFPNLGQKYKRTSIAKGKLIEKVFGRTMKLEKGGTVVTVNRSSLVKYITENYGLGHLENNEKGPTWDKVNEVVLKLYQESKKDSNKPVDNVEQFIARVVKQLDEDQKELDKNLFQLIKRTEGTVLKKDMKGHGPTAMDDKQFDIVIQGCLLESDRKALEYFRKEYTYLSNEQSLSQESYEACIGLMREHIDAAPVNSLLHNFEGSIFAFSTPKHHIDGLGNFGHSLLAWIDDPENLEKFNIEGTFRTVGEANIPQGIRNAAFRLSSLESTFNTSGIQELTSAVSLTCDQLSQLAFSDLREPPFDEPISFTDIDSQFSPCQTMSLEEWNAAIGRINQTVKYVGTVDSAFLNEDTRKGFKPLDASTKDSYLAFYFAASELYQYVFDHRDTTRMNASNIIIGARKVPEMMYAIEQLMPDEFEEAVLIRCQSTLQWVEGLSGKVGDELTSDKVRKTLLETLGLNDDVTWEQVQDLLQSCLSEDKKRLSDSIPRAKVYQILELSFVALTKAPEQHRKAAPPLQLNIGPPTIPRAKRLLLQLEAHSRQHKSEEADKIISQLNACLSESSPNHVQLKSLMVEGRAVLKTLPPLQEAEQQQLKRTLLATPLLTPLRTQDQASTPNESDTPAESEMPPVPDEPIGPPVAKPYRPPSEIKITLTPQREELLRQIQELRKELSSQMEKVKAHNPSDVHLKQYALILDHLKSSEQNPDPLKVEEQKLKLTELNESYLETRRNELATRIEAMEEACRHPDLQKAFGEEGQVVGLNPSKYKPERSLFYRSPADIRTTESLDEIEEMERRANSQIKTTNKRLRKKKLEFLANLTQKRINDLDKLLAKPSIDDQEKPLTDDARRKILLHLITCQSTCTQSNTNFQPSAMIKEINKATRSALKGMIEKEKLLSPEDCKKFPDIEDQLLSRLEDKFYKRQEIQRPDFNDIYTIVYERNFFTDKFVSELKAQEGWEDNEKIVALISQLENGPFVKKGSFEQCIRNAQRHLKDESIVDAQEDLLKYFDGVHFRKEIANDLRRLKQPLLRAELSSKEEVEAKKQEVIQCLRDDLKNFYVSRLNYFDKIIDRKDHTVDDATVSEIKGIFEEEISKLLATANDADPLLVTHQIDQVMKRANMTLRIINNSNRCLYETNGHLTTLQEARSQRQEIEKIDLLEKRFRKNFEGQITFSKQDILEVFRDSVQSECTATDRIRTTDQTEFEKTLTTFWKHTRSVLDALELETKQQTQYLDKVTKTK